jgi:lipoate-protein ligase A
MASPRCRLLPFHLADGPWQMAADEALLEAAGRGVASLRFYGWPAATLSLGYFQPASVRRADPLLRELPWVRRPSGGSALVHHHEVTYALALPAGRPWQTKESCALCMHRVIAAGLASLGVDVRLAGPQDERKLGEVLCFLHHTPGDLLLGPAKVAGSAQRKQRGALMQHGGILLSASPFTPALPGIAELSGRQLTAEEVAQAVAGELARATGWELVSGEWAPGELARIDELRAGKYATRHWNEKR